MGPGRSSAWAGAKPSERPLQRVQARPYLQIGVPNGHGERRTRAEDRHTRGDGFLEGAPALEVLDHAPVHRTRFRAWRVGTEFGV